MKKYLASISLVALLTLSGCTWQRPQMSGIPETLDQHMQRPVSVANMLPVPEKPNPGSLWVPGTKQFFKDSRATRVGDIVTVVVTEKAEANTEAKTEADKTDTNQGGWNALLNLENKLSARGFATGAAALLDTSTNRNFEGEGKTKRKDTLEARIAAVVTQVLPNGYLVIRGKREVAVNYELQELRIEGIVRPEDVSAQNTISSDKIAEARVFYAGRGIVDKSQRPQWGSEIVQEISPF